ncbi:9517_t:CDS:2 [Acaulospora morrowiae]|uniref:9517_t:CDS:1 n=1 Tax=Acaulospora morrowiae TaxID=94023 RepID=A0A9N9AVM7_9GLOM|nr:9517_t:CDS:2 [Acaulospora morrowiae]
MKKFLNPGSSNVSEKTLESERSSMNDTTSLKKHGNESDENTNRESFDQVAEDHSGSESDDDQDTMSDENSTTGTDHAEHELYRKEQTENGETNIIDHAKNDDDDKELNYEENINENGDHDLRESLPIENKDSDLDKDQRDDNDRDLKSSTTNSGKTGELYKSPITQNSIATSEDQRTHLSEPDDKYVNVEKQEEPDDKYVNVEKREEPDDKYVNVEKQENSIPKSWDEESQKDDAGDEWKSPNSDPPAWKYPDDLKNIKKNSKGDQVKPQTSSSLSANRNQHLTPVRRGLSPEQFENGVYIGNLDQLPPMGIAFYMFGLYVESAFVQIADKIRVIDRISGVPISNWFLWLFSLKSWMNIDDDDRRMLE